MDLFSNLQLLHEAAISVLVTTIYGRWRTITGVTSYIPGADGAKNSLVGACELFRN